MTRDEQKPSLNFLYNREEVKSIIDRNLQFGMKNISKGIAEEVFCYLACLKIKHEAKLKEQPCGGDKKCPVCKGTGSDPKSSGCKMCWRCGGSGICLTCGGSELVIDEEKGETIEVDGLEMSNLKPCPRCGKRLDPRCTLHTCNMSKTERR